MGVYFRLQLNCKYLEAGSGFFFFFFLKQVVWIAAPGRDFVYNRCVQ